jgi:hypothetical protein
LVLSQFSQSVYFSGRTSPLIILSQRAVDHATDTA